MTTAYQVQVRFQCGYESHHRLNRRSVGIDLQWAGITATDHHPVQAIIDDDLLGMIGRFLEGVIVVKPLPI
jgi:hypothetical protein